LHKLLAFPSSWVNWAPAPHLNVSIGDSVICQSCHENDLYKKISGL
jgi:hypothetical protein